jgi:hypothetical protein
LVVAHDVLGHLVARSGVKEEIGETRGRRTEGAEEEQKKSKRGARIQQ